MATTSSAAASPKKRKLGRIIIIALAVIIIPVAVGYFVLTSTFFLKKVILPSVSKSIGAEITVADASISPFSKVHLQKLKVQKAGAEPLLKAEEIIARYRLMDIVRGNINVDELTVISPVIQMIKTDEDHYNFPSSTEPKEPSSSRSSDDKIPQLNIRNVSLKNATILLIEKYADGNTTTAGLTNFDLKISQLKNGASGSIEISSHILVQGTSDTTPSFDIYPLGALVGTNSSLKSLLSGKIDFALTKDLLPQNAKGSAQLVIGNATGAYHDLSELSAILNCEITPSEIRQLSLNFVQAGQPLGELSASGPFSFATTEGNLNVKLSSIDRRVLNLVGAPKGFDFNSIVINADNDLVFAQKGNSISVTGQLNANELSITETATKQTTPTLNFQTAYQIKMDQTSESALVEKLNLNGTQNGQQILRGSLSKPMPISWGGTAGAPEDAAFQLAITDLNLADWKSFAGETAPSGKLNAKVDVLSQQAGKKLTMDITSRLDALSAKFGSNQISNADVDVKAKATIAEMEKISLSEYSVQLSQNKEPSLTMAGSGTVDLADDNADVKISVNGTLAQLFKIVVVPDMAASAGTLKFDGQITQRKEAQTVKGNFALTGLTGTYAGSPLDRFGAAFDLDLGMDGDKLEIRKANGTLQQAGQPGGTFDVSGKYNSGNGTGNIEMKLADVNENALRPFLAESLGEKELVTISVNGNATAYLQEKSSSFKGDIDLKNFVVRDAKTKKTDEPLSAQVQLDGTKRNEVFDLNKFQITLSPTQRAKNQLNITGQLDLSKTNAIKGQLLVQSDSFDVTPFYDLYSPAEEKVASANTPTPTAPGSNDEPEAMKLPVERIVAEINIGQFYLREIEIKNWRWTAKIEGNRVLLNPFQLTLNNAPVSVNADLNLGVKGYAYDFTASLNGVPLEPLANSFIPEERGAYKGTIIANAKIKGAGTTGVSLKKSLTGDADLVFTNANIQIVGKRLKPFLSTVAAILQAPELTATPVEWVSSQLKFGDGAIDLQRFEMQSDAFTANLKGVIPIADELTNSPLRKLPINFGVSYSLAQKARLTSSSTPTNVSYVMLPAGFLAARGTLGDPKPDIDEKKLLGFALEKFGGKIPGLDEKTGNLIQGLGGLLGGKPQQQPTNQTTLTNQPGSTNNVAPQTNSNQQLIDGVLDLFNKKKK